VPIGRIQREARGLLNFLDIVGQTARPAAIGDIVEGSIDLMPFYGGGLLAGRSQGGNLQNQGDTLSLVVPDGEAWLILAGQYAMNAMVAGELVRLSFAVGLKDGNIIRLSSMPGPVLAAINGDVVGSSFTMEHPILLTAGNSIITIAEQVNVAAARNSNVGAAVYVFDI